jgi:predicted transcriptional regulator
MGRKGTRPSVAALVTTVKLDQAQKTKLVAMSIRRNCSIALLLRESLEHYLEREFAREEWANMIGEQLPQTAQK